MRQRVETKLCIRNIIKEINTWRGPRKIFMITFKIDKGENLKALRVRDDRDILCLEKEKRMRQYLMLCKRINASN